MPMNRAKLKFEYKLVIQSTTYWRPQDTILIAICYNFILQRFMLVTKYWCLWKVQYIWNWRFCNERIL